MTIYTCETEYKDIGEFQKRVERKHTKSSMALLLAKMYWIITDENLTDEQKLEEITKLQQRVAWG